MTTYCPICGEGTDQHTVSAPGLPSSQMHRCRAKVVRGIDAALATDADHRREPSFEKRLADGFAMMQDDEQGD